MSRCWVLAACTTACRQKSATDCLKIFESKSADSRSLCESCASNSAHAKFSLPGEAAFLPQIPQVEAGRGVKCVGSPVSWPERCADSCECQQFCPEGPATSRRSRRQHATNAARSQPYEHE